MSAYYNIGVKELFWGESDFFRVSCRLPHHSPSYGAQGESRGGDVNASWGGGFASYTHCGLTNGIAIRDLRAGASVRSCVCLSRVCP